MSAVDHVMLYWWKNQCCQHHIVGFEVAMPWKQDDQWRLPGGIVCELQDVQSWSGPQASDGIHIVYHLMAMSVPWSQSKTRGSKGRAKTNWPKSGRGFSLLHKILEMTMKAGLGQGRLESSWVSGCLRMSSTTVSVKLTRRSTGAIAELLVLPDQPTQCRLSASWTSGRLRNLHCYRMLLFLKRSLTLHLTLCAIWNTKRHQRRSLKWMKNFRWTYIVLWYYVVRDETTCNNSSKW